MAYILLDTYREKRNPVRLWFFILADVNAKKIMSEPYDTHLFSIQRKRSHLMTKPTKSAKSDQSLCCALNG